MGSLARKGKGGKKNGEKSPFQPLLPLDLCIFSHLESASLPQITVHTQFGWRETCSSYVPVFMLGPV